jgi:hypothetical protein
VNLALQAGASSVGTVTAVTESTVVKKVDRAAVLVRLRAATIVGANGRGAASAGRERCTEDRSDAD